MRELLLNGNTVEQKLKHAEIILGRLARREKKTISVLMPPCPISAYRDDIPGVGMFYTFLSSIEGTIKSVCLEVQCTKFKGAKISMLVESKGASAGASFPIANSIGSFETSVGVKKGDKVVFYLLEIDRAPEEVGSISIALGFSIIPIRQEAEGKTLAIEE
ncbi:MAG: hypothetical protein WC208_16675 [Gallionella sp.]